LTKNVGVIRTPLCRALATSSSTRFRARASASASTGNGTSATFSLLGFIIGIWADGFEKLQLVPLLIVTPLTFLGGSFYSIDMLPPLWQKVTLFNPVVYLISGFRWSFFGLADVAVWISMVMTLVFMAICLAIIAWIFKTGYRLKT
jgi:ABC-2 type transport system permease protein